METREGHSKTRNKRRGGILAISALSMSVILGLIAMSIDVGHLYLVRLELKNASVAMALHGAGHLYPSDPAGGPNWILAEEKALEAVLWNTADGNILSSAVVTTGYWDLSGVIPGIRPPVDVPNPGPNDVPAVSVAIYRIAGLNGGAVPLYFGSVIGIPTKDVSAMSVAVAGSPQSVEENSLFPIAVPASVYNDFWDASSQKPKIDSSTGKPFVFDIAAKDNGLHGQWSTFDSGCTSVPCILGLIDNGNPEPLSIGQMVHLAPGIKTSIYTSIPSDIDVGVAILSNTTGAGQREIVGFGALHIHFATGGASQSITVSLTENKKMVGSTVGGGVYKGAYAPPKLVY